jgi:hypothetical protein
MWLCPIKFLNSNLDDKRCDEACSWYLPDEGCAVRLISNNLDILATKGVEKLDDISGNVFSVAEQFTEANKYDQALPTMSSQMESVIEQLEGISTSINNLELSEIE